MLLSQIHETFRPIDAMEARLVRACVSDSRLLSTENESLLRTALSLARMHRVRGPRGDVEVGDFLAKYRSEVTAVLSPALGNGKAPSGEQLRTAAGVLAAPMRATYESLIRHFASDLPAEAIDREVRYKALVVVAGGGGGTGYVYLGAYSLLQDWGVHPSLIVATSMGAILGLFRARMARMETSDVIAIVRSLSWSKLFRLVSMDSRYGLPAALRLFLRAGIGQYFNREDGQTLRLCDLPVPLIVTVGGIRRGALRHPLEYYESLLSFGSSLLPNPLVLRKKIPQVMRALVEFISDPGMLEPVYLGSDPDTREFDALDAVGFSSAVPGVIHYDLVRDDPRMQAMIESVFERHRLFRFIDGGFADNVPSEAAWRAVQEGTIATRNAFILALDGFSPKITTPIWLPMEQLAAANAENGKAFSHLYRPFPRTLSPIELVPSVQSVLKAISFGKEALTPDMPFIARMLTPLPPVTP
jgi:predicted acylesterase/phospholipase RssA